MIFDISAYKPFVGREHFCCDRTTSSITNNSGMAVRTFEMKEMTRLHPFPAKNVIVFPPNQNSLNLI